MEPNISVDTLKQTVNTVNTITPLLVGGISGLFAVVTAMALYIVKMHKSVTNIIAQNAKSNEHLALSIDNLPERIADKIELRMNK